jgi:hypothetical protein
MKPARILTLFFLISFSVSGQISHLLDIKGNHIHSTVDYLNIDLPDYNMKDTGDWFKLFDGIADYGSPPPINWYEQFGGSGEDFARDMVTDWKGNVYLTGSFSGEISVDGNFSFPHGSGVRPKHRYLTI